jgi:Fe-S cluster assembly ATP-binding protein
MGVLIITHYQRILRLVQPTHVHILYRGRVVKEGGPDLVGEIEATGYEPIIDTLVEEPVAS